MNKTVLMGRLAREPEVRYTQSGMAIARVVLAVDRYQKEQKTADFIPCVMFGKTAEMVGNSCQKGHRLLVEGSIKTGSYEKDGAKVYTTEVYVDRMEFIERKAEGT